MTAREWAAKLPAHWADDLTDAATTNHWDEPMSKWEVFDTLATYVGGLTAMEAYDLIKEVYGIQLR